MPRRPLLLLTLAAVGLALAGCNTVDHRIKEKSATFASLPPAQQQTLREGRVELGYTTDMAYIALGKADQVTERATDQGVVTVWTYLSYSEEYAGQQRIGFARRVALDRKTGRAFVYYVPVDAPVFRERIEEVLRLEFFDGKITAIEEPKKEE